jgi:hypothetical protein
MLQNAIQLGHVNRSIKNPLRDFTTVILNIFSNMEVNKPLYYFTLPGFILGTSGLYMTLECVQTFQPEGVFNIEYAVLMVLLTFVGSLMAFTGVLLHSIAGLIRHEFIKP